MVGVSILCVPAPIQPNHAGQELHQQSLSILPVPAYHAQIKQLYQESLQVLPGPASFKTKDSVKAFVCVFCQGVTSLVIGEFLQFQVR